VCGCVVSLFRGRAVDKTARRYTGGLNMSGIWVAAVKCSDQWRGGVCHSAEKYEDFSNSYCKLMDRAAGDEQLDSA
jgi:hypothetical protein